MVTYPGLCGYHLHKGINLITCERSFFKIVSKGSAEGHSLKK